MCPRGTESKRQMTFMAEGKRQIIEKYHKTITLSPTHVGPQQKIPIVKMTSPYPAMARGILANLGALSSLS